MKKIHLLLTLIGLIAFVGCTEPYALKTSNYEEALVIEATITNELKHQEIKISKTYRLEQTAPTIVTDATVFITDNYGNTYDFIEQNGIYVSSDAFEAIPNRQYQLSITTEDGRNYSSTSETLTSVSPIQSVVPTQTTKEGVRGVAMVVNSYDPTNSSKYYRFEYEETNKIVAPKWVSVKASGTYIPNASGNIGGQITLNPRTYEARTCFNTKKSNTIIQASTNNLTEDRVAFPVRFISNDDYTIAVRYSIMVKQYVQNLASYTYFKTLKELSSTSSILSQNQPGFFSGNIRCTTNPDEKVIGYFEVSSVSSERIFFNYNELFPNENAPKYPYDCEVDPERPNDDPEHFFKFCFGISLDCNASFLIDSFNQNKSVYYNNVGLIYEIYDAPCGDCTTFSSNIIPPFWHD